MMLNQVKSRSSALDVLYSMECSTWLWNFINFAMSFIEMEYDNLKDIFLIYVYETIRI